ncbi:MAG: autotransporter outer membrane beta-barrel domain-containing protein, partial [Zoogloeaceae bacterium]|nr:autotransporter outer membrane beta-barrel domain-containing protein [Zoogloeaceae bacterium]
GSTTVTEDSKLTLDASSTLTTSEVILENDAQFALAATDSTLTSPALTLNEGSWFDNSVGGTYSLANGTLTVVNQASYSGDLDAENATVNFRVDEHFVPSATSPILVVSGNANLDNATLTAAVMGTSAAVTSGDELYLLEVYGGALSATGLKTATVSDQGLINIELGDLNIASGSNGSIRGTIKSIGANERTKAYAEGFLGGAAALTSAGDHAARAAVSAARNVKAAGGAAGATGFAEIRGGSLKYETGSHVDVDGYYLIGGAAIGSNLAAGELTLGAFVEYGEGDYSTYNSFASGRVKGKGDTDYAGGGALARFAFTNGFYLDGTLRLGKVDNDFRSAQINGALTAYDTSSRYHGAHAGAGKIWQLGDNSLDVSAQYLWTRQKGDKVRLKGVAAMELDFDAVDSRRLRLAARYNHALSQTLVGYVGTAWEKEFDGKAKATLNGRKLLTPELKGDSGLVELGLSTAPFAKTPLSIDVGVQGYWGQREGVTGGFKVNYRF